MAEDQDEGGAGGEDEVVDDDAGAEATDDDEAVGGTDGTDDEADGGDGVVDDADESDEDDDEDGGDGSSPYDAMVEDDDEDDGEERDDDEVVYELDDWSGESRLLADGLLENAGIARVWQGGTLVIAAEDEEAVDEIVDNVDAMATPALDPDAPKLAYEVGDWTDAQRTGLAQRLGELAIPYEWDEQGDLVVLEEDEERVEELFDAIESPEELDAGLGDEEDDGGLAAQEVLSDLFVSSDRLMHDARDAEGVLTFVDAATRARGLSLPFGFERGVWDEIVARAGALAGDFENDVEDDDLIVERATELRNLLRGYV